MNSNTPTGLSIAEVTFPKIAINILYLYFQYLPIKRYYSRCHYTVMKWWGREMVIRYLKLIYWSLILPMTREIYLWIWMGDSATSWGDCGWDNTWMSPATWRSIKPVHWNARYIFNPHRPLRTKKVFSIRHRNLLPVTQFNVKAMVRTWEQQVSGMEGLRWGMGAGQKMA